MSIGGRGERAWLESNLSLAEPHRRELLLAIALATDICAAALVDGGSAVLCHPEARPGKLRSNGAWTDFDSGKPSQAR
ncbi:unnamed protein product [Peniophora sp. CBMAI 1063]|nr:unnamed protein product [Peniophora sp. CBMAI 1063]